MTVDPGSTWLVTKGCSEAEEPSARIAMRHRPIPFGSRTSTAMPVSTFLPGARPPPQPGLIPADERLIHLHDPGQPVPARPDQHRPQPVQHRPRGRVRADLQRPLQALRRDAVLLCCEQPARGEPHRQRRPCPVEDSARRHRTARMTRGALQPAIPQPPAPGLTAVRAGNPARPAQPLQVVQAVRVGTEPGLELARGPRVVNPGAGLIHARILLRLTEYPRRAYFAVTRWLRKFVQGIAQ